MTSKKRMLFFVSLDTLIIIVSIAFSYWLIYSQALETPYVTNVIIIITSMIVIFHFIYAVLFRLYNKVLKYASVGELLIIAQTVTLTIVSTALFQWLLNGFIVYKRLLIVTWMVYIILIGATRFVWRIYRDRGIRGTNNNKRTIIVGAGSAGAMIARQLNGDQHNSGLFPVAIVDDDINKQHMQIYNIPVEGQVSDIPELVESLNVEHIIIAIPSLKNGELHKIVNKCNETDATVQMIPKIEDLMTGKVTVSSLKNVEVEDLLGREQVELDIHSIQNSVTEEVVLVTGAGGSIGSEICRQLMRFSPKKLILFGHGEYSIYLIDKELKDNLNQKDVEIIPIIGNVRNRSRVDEVIAMYQPKIIYHAAAYKHVPLMEYNAHEAVANNVLGTKNVAEIAEKHHVNTFVLVSTDKAVNPPNVMGATKRIAEMMIQHMSETSDTKYVAVRFGNVLGSRGSVIPLFKKQIESGGPITITDREMTRYFMTIPEASKLVVQAGTLARGGEVFVLDMGKPVKILDLAKNLIQLSGYTENDIDIIETGIRPGEKLHEEIMNEDEVHSKQIFDKIYIGKTKNVNIQQIENLLLSFDQMTNDDLKNNLIAIANHKSKSREIDKVLQA